MGLSEILSHPLIMTSTEVTLREETPQSSGGGGGGGQGLTDSIIYRTGEGHAEDRKGHPNPWRKLI